MYYLLKNGAIWMAIFTCSFITFMVLFLILHVESLWNSVLYKEAYKVWNKHLLKFVLKIKH